MNQNKLPPATARVADALRTALPRRRCSIAGALVFAIAVRIGAGQPDPALPGTELLSDWADPAARTLAGLDRFLTHELQRVAANRSALWRPDFSSPEAYVRSLDARRERLRQIVGAVDTRLPVRALELVGSTASPAKVAATESFAVFAVRWPVFDGVHGEGLWLRPNTTAIARVVAIPDADQTPEQIAGLAPGLNSERQFARRLAEQGCEVLVPVLISREWTDSGSRIAERFTDQPHREWIYRQAFPLGRHIIGYELQKIRAALDAFESLPTPTRANPPPGSDSPGPSAAAGPPDASRIPIGLAGYGEGGLLALYTAALDERVAATLVSGYFDSRTNLWTEPIYRNVFGLLREFSDAEIAMLVAPRALIVEHAPAPKTTGKPPPPDRRRTAAPGRLVTPDYSSVEAEFERARRAVRQGALKDFDAFTLISGAEGMTTGPMSDRALAAFVRALGSPVDRARPAGPMPVDLRPNFDPAERQCRQLTELVHYTQRLLQQAERARADFFWKRLRTDSPEHYAASTRPLRAFLETEILGADLQAPGPLHPRSRRFEQRAGWTAYELALDVWPDSPVYGLLLLPNDRAADERRPAVVCLHGLEGTPADLLASNPADAAFGLYRSLAARLADRGFVVLALQGPYRGGEAFRQPQRKAHPLGRTLAGLMAAQLRCALDWLAAQPFVDPERIGGYGFSYGGNALMHLAPLLPRWAAVVCSGSFNEWSLKTVSTDDPRSFLFTPEHEIFTFNLANTFSHAELAALIAPRPFMVERGRRDPVGRDEWVSYEFARAQRLYEQLGAADRIAIEFFDGGHTVHGEGTFRFLHRHLQWPEPAR